MIEYNGQFPVPQTESVPCEFCAAGFHTGTAFTKDDAKWNARHEKGKCREKYEALPEIDKRIADNIMRRDREAWPVSVTPLSDSLARRAGL